LRKIIKPNFWRVAQITLMVLYVFILSEYRLHAQVSNYGNFYVPDGASVSLPTNFINSSNAKYENNGTVYFGADFENNQPSLNRGTGSTHFVGLNTQTLSGNSPIFINDFTINKTNFLQLNNSISVYGNIRFNNGYITSTQINQLVLEASAAIIGSPSENSFVNGPVQWKTDAVRDYLFPLGIFSPSIKYYPISVHVAEVSGTSGFVAEVKASNPILSPFGDKFIDPSLVGLVSDRYWNVSKTGNAKARVKLQYPGNDLNVNWTPLDPDEESKIAVAKWNPQITEDGNGFWSFTKADNFNFSIAPFFESRLYNVAGPVYSDEITEFTAFTIGHGKSQILPVRLLTFDVLHQNNNQAFLKWAVLNDDEVNDFVVQYSVDGIQFSDLAIVAGKGGNSYSHIHQSLSPGTHYYKIVIREKTGNRLSSAVKQIVLQSATYIKGLRETVVTSRAIPVLFSSSHQNITFRLLDVSGRIIKTQQLKAQKGMNEWSIEMGHLASGVYFLNITTEDGVISTLRLIKSN
jgi:hypothetical protein